MKARKKYVYFFGNKKADGKAVMKNLLGGKGANLAEMTNLGIPVPAGFTITTEVCAEYYRNNKKYPSGLRDQVEKNLALVEKTMGATFGSDTNPLLVSVRSGAPVSMPGMMDTILNLGLNDRVVLGIIKKTRDERFAYDSYRRFVQMYANVVMKMNISKLEHLLEEKKHQKGITLDNEMTALDWKDLVYAFKAKIKEYTGKDFPDDPREQLWGAIGAVFNSWMTKRAIEYRRINTISEDLGTAVNVQSMVFGNMGNDSATGVAFTRDPGNGEDKFYGEYLVNAQGDDVVAGIRTPSPINTESRSEHNKNLPVLEDLMPKAYKELFAIQKKLENHYKDMQDIEFTIEKGRLFMLQCRIGKRNGPAAVRIAVDMVKEKLITKEMAVMRVTPAQIDELLHPMIDPKAEKDAKLIAKGLPAGPG